MKVSAKINGTEVWTIWTEYLPSIIASIEKVIQEDGIVIIKPTKERTNKRNIWNNIQEQILINKLTFKGEEYELQNHSERNQSEEALRGNNQRESEDQERSNENSGPRSGSEEVPGRKPTRKSRGSNNTMAGSKGTDEVK